MRTLILGGSGMLGHKLWQTLENRFDTYVTFRQAPADRANFQVFDPARSISGVLAEDIGSLERAFALARPETVVNCIGIVKQDSAAKDPVACITVNALLPHQLATLCQKTGARLIQLSTDCVFSGRKGNYTLADRPDAEDLYGRTKLLGEVEQENCLTIRTSMIGRELAGSHGLIEWFLGQKGKTVRGYKRAIFSGFTTSALSDIIVELIIRHPKLSGIRHVASVPINKFDLLTLVKQTYGLDTEITPDETFACDRSLDGSSFRAETNISAPSWPQMIARMHDDKTPYDELRRIDVTE